MKCLFSLTKWNWVQLKKYLIDIQNVSCYRYLVEYKSKYHDFSKKKSDFVKITRPKFVSDLKAI